MAEKSIGEIIRERRIELGLTQEELADRLGYKHKSSINKIELGINGVQQKKIKDFAAALDTTEEYLLGLSGSHSAPAGAQTMDEFFTKLYEAFKGSDDRTREIILQILNVQKED